jgi:single-strand selective monofunctional uracil DNA glycosylase
VDFFKERFVLNYCPLVFMEESGRNRTPDKLPTAEQASLAETCSRHLRLALDALKPPWAVGVGKFAEGCLLASAPEGVRVGTILHPSPAAPLANRDWSGTAAKQLASMGVWP